MADDDDTQAGGPSVLDQYEADRNAHLDRIADLEDELVQARQADVQVPERDPIEAQLQRARDLGDEGELARLYRERDAAEEAAQLQREQAERAARDAELAKAHGWADYERETQRLAASDDPAERDAAVDRLGRGEFAAQARDRETLEAATAVAHEQMDAASAAKGFLPGGLGHVDGDSHVAAMKRSLDQLERHGADPRDIEQQRQAIDDRVRELFEDPNRLGTTAPGSQTVPGSEAVDAQTIDARIEAAEQQARLTGDWTEWDRLQVRATTSR